MRFSLISWKREFSFPHDRSWETQGRRPERGAGASAEPGPGFLFIPPRWINLSSLQSQHLAAEERADGGESKAGQLEDARGLPGGNSPVPSLECAVSIPQCRSRERTAVVPEALCLRPSHKHTMSGRTLSPAGSKCPEFLISFRLPQTL